MSSKSFRPRFKLISELSTEQIIQGLRNECASDPKGRFVFKNAGGHLILDVAQPLRHFWSPHLDIDLEEEDGRTVLRCLVGPAPTVWTLFMFFYGLCGFAGFAGLILGLSQWTLRKETWGFWLVLVSLLGMVGLYVISSYGRRLAHTEMKQLKSLVHTALDAD